MPNNCRCLADILEDLIEKTILDQDWRSTEFFQDILEVCLGVSDKVSRPALQRLVALIPETTGCACCNAS